MRITTLLIVLFTSQIFAQLSSSSLIQVYDAASVSLGEAGVANKYYGIPSNINPALLNEQENFKVYVNRRSMDWIETLDDMVFLSAGIQIPTNMGNFAFNYKRFSQGEFNTVSPEGYEIVGKHEVFDHTFELLYGTRIWEGLSAGAVIKLFTFNDRTIEGSYNLNVNTPLYLDLGLTYKFDELISSPRLNDDLILGIDIQNFGTDLTIAQNYVNDPFFGTTTRESILEVQRYIRIGFGYNLEIKSENDCNIFRFAFNAQYKNQLNNFHNDNSEKDFWGMGMEAAFYEILSLRVGAISNPNTNIYGIKGVFNARYGLGIQTPVITSIKNLPFKIAFDYAVIPIIHLGYFSNSMNRNNLDAFNLSISFPGISLL